MRQRLLYRDEKRMAYAANFAAELAEILYELDMTHRELSLQLGVAQATVDSWTRIENPKIPGDRNLQRLGELLEKLKPSAGTRLRSALGKPLAGGEHGTQSPLLATVERDEALRANGATAEVEEQSFAQPAIAADYPNNFLPSLTQFVGRAQEILEVRQLLKKFRLVSLVGTGGIGKTRLALEVAHGLDGYPDGVWLVELDALQDPELVPAAIAQALPSMQQSGTLSGGSLAAHIGEKRLLLLLDNCEHLVEACAQLSETLLQTSPNIAILATSREILGCPGEMVWRAQALSIPQSHNRSKAENEMPDADAIFREVVESESGQLFLACARERHSTFELTAQNAPYVAEVCNKLEGIPLALELAAARISAISIEEISQRLHTCLQLLTRGRRTRLPSAELTK